MKARSKTIMFDLGGVLTFVDWGNVCQRFSQGSRRSPQEVLNEIVWGDLCQSFMRGELDPGAFHRSFCRFLGRGLDYPEFVEEWRSPFTPNKEINGLIRTLGADHTLVLGSNTDALHFPHLLQNMEVLQGFGQYFLSYQLGYLKPDPQFFQRALRELGIAPGGCVFVDDILGNVESARNLGITAIQFQSSRQLEADLDALGLL